jgi:hypothetical protein
VILFLFPIAVLHRLAALASRRPESFLLNSWLSMLWWTFISQVGFLVWLLATPQCAALYRRAAAFTAH